MKQSYQLVTVITPCFNDGPYIKECVESVQQSTYPNIQHIIIDDGSEKETKDVLATIKYPNVIIITKENEGVCITRNLAIEKAGGKYILPLDGDDKISADYIERCVASFEDNDNVRIATSEISQLFGCENRQIVVDFPFDMGILLSRNLFTVTTMFRKEDAIRVGCFDLDFKEGLEDWNFWISIMALGGEVAIISGANFFYRIKKKHRNSSIGGEEGLRALKRKVWEKHKELYSMYYADPNETDAYLGLCEYKNRSLIRIIAERIKRQIKKIIKR